MLKDFVMSNKKSGASETSTVVATIDTAKWEVGVYLCGFHCVSS